MNFTKNLEEFFDNNTPGGYIQTNVTIGESDLDARINAAVQKQGFLTSASHISWNQIDEKPILFSGNWDDLNHKPTLFSGDYNDLIHKPNIPIINISNTLTKGTRLATITINGVNTDIYGGSGEDGIGTETDPIFLASPAANITNDHIASLSTLNDNIDTLINYSTLLDNKAKIVYIDVEQPPYSYSNFGMNSFFSTTDTLINDICGYLDTTNIVVLVSSNGSWIITYYFINESLNIKVISLNYIGGDTYYECLQTVSNIITQNEDETEDAYANRFNSAILNYLSLNNCMGLMIKDNNQNCSYFRFYQENITEVIIGLDQRLKALEALENSKNNTNPDNQENLDNSNSDNFDESENLENLNDQEASNNPKDLES